MAESQGHDPPDWDTVLLLQHPAVYTLGAGSTIDHLHFDPESPPHPVHRTERGGEVTYHGPGQLVLYPIMNLKKHTPDMHWYLRSLEEVVIRYGSAESHFFPATVCYVQESLYVCSSTNRTSPAVPLH